MAMLTNNVIQNKRCYAGYNKQEPPSKTLRLPCSQEFWVSDLNIMVKCCLDHLNIKLLLLCSKLN